MTTGRTRMGLCHEGLRDSQSTTIIAPSPPFLGSLAEGEKDSSNQATGLKTIQTTFKYSMSFALA